MTPVFSDVFTKMALASTPYREAIGTRLVSLRDFLLLFFFIDLGVGLDLATLGTQVVPAILFSLFVLIENPLIVMSILGVDFDPDLVIQQHKNGYPVCYGDAEDPEFIATLPLNQVSLVLSSVREMPINLALLHGLQSCNYNGSVALTAHTVSNAEKLKFADADRIPIPYIDAGRETLNNLFNTDKKEK